MDTPEKVAETPADEKAKAGETPQETVTLSKKEHEQLLMNQNLAHNLQEENERLKNARPKKKVSPPKTEFSFEEPEEEDKPSKPAEEQLAQQQEFVRLKSLVNSAIAENPKFLTLISEDSILRRVISSNPLSLLTPAEQENLRDADEAVEKIKYALEEHVSKISPKAEEDSTEKKSPEAVNPSAIPTPVKPEAPKKGGQVGAEESILSKIKQA
jgi:hypothetical protein